jgi:hypothetical protein
LAQEAKPILVGAKADERPDIEAKDENSVAMGFVDPLKVRHLGAAWRAVASPEIQHNGLALLK